jgi:hypothetical protein
VKAPGRPESRRAIDGWGVPSGGQCPVARCLVCRSPRLVALLRSLKSFGLLARPGHRTTTADTGSMTWMQSTGLASRPLRRTSLEYLPDPGG